MKTLMKKLFSALLMLVLVAGMLNVHARVAPLPVYRSGDAFRQVVVIGNARVTLVQSKRHGVLSLYEYDSSKTKVQRQGHTLYIRSNEKVPAELTVYVDELYRIDVSGTAVVKTKGVFNVPLMQIFLHDLARADVRLNAEGIYTIGADQSELTLRGATKEHIIEKSLGAKLNTTQFAVLTIRTEDMKSKFAGNGPKPLEKDTVK